MKRVHKKRLRKNRAIPSLTLEESLALILKQSQNRHISIQTILETLSGNGRLLLIILLCLPFCQPLQIPGLSIPFGLMIAFLGLRQGLGHRIWLPKKVLHKTISPEVLNKIVAKTLWLTKKMKRWVHPRLKLVCLHPFMHPLNGVIIALLGIFLALPLPIPFSNLVASWAIFFISLGLLEEDGLLVCIGYVITVLCIAFFVALFFSVKLFHIKPLP